MSTFLPPQEENSARTEENVDYTAHGRNVSSSINEDGGDNDVEDGGDNDVKDDSGNDVVDDGGNDVVGDGGDAEDDGSDDPDDDPLSASVHREGLTNDVPQDEGKTVEEMASREGSSQDGDKGVEILEGLVNRAGLLHDGAKDEETACEKAASVEENASSYDGREILHKEMVGKEDKVSSYFGECKLPLPLYDDIKKGRKTFEQVFSVDCEDPSDGCEEVTRKTLTLDEVDRILIDMESKFAPFVRHDIYGRMGKEEIPVFERVRLLVAFGTIVPLRVVLLLAIVILGYSICRICTLFIPPDQIEESIGEEKHDLGVMVTSRSQENYANLCGWHRAVIVFTGKLLSRAFLFVLGFYWISVTNIEDGFKEAGPQPAAVISNHVSYIDILYHISAVFPSFSPKRSVADLPIIGLISKCLGCVFVQREEKPTDFKGVSGIIRERMQAAARDENVPLMMLFPEGTTTNGFYLLPFKTGAFLAGTPIQPVILRYPYIHFSPAWETISGVRHFFLLLCQFINYLEVLWLPVYRPSEVERADPRLYARNVRKLIAVEGGLFLSDAGLREKRIYHSFLNGSSRVHLRKHLEEEDQGMSYHFFLQRD